MTAVDEHLVRLCQRRRLAPDTAIRRHIAGVRLRGVSSPASERMAASIHTCGHLVRDRLLPRSATGTRPPSSSRCRIRSIAPAPPRASAGPAVRHRGRHLHRGAARRPWGLDVVDGIGGVDCIGRGWSRSSGSDSAARGS
jgi:hypothetical protein